MNRCPISYEPCEGQYSMNGLKLLSSRLTHLNILEYSAAEQRAEAHKRAAKMSIQGLQPKLSAVLNIKEKRFELVDRGGRYILKPQHQYYEQMPENEDLTMKMAAVAGLEVPPHGMIWSKDHTRTYFIKRFDRKGQKDKIAVEDFAQLAGLTRDTKYNYSMEKVVKLIDEFCTFPAVEKMKLFKRILFCYLTGNEDMHLKNFSIISREGKIELSPCYDLLNTTIELDEPAEEIALPIAGKKKNLTRDLLISYFGRERCTITEKVIETILKKLESTVPRWLELIDQSFLTANMKKKYIDLLYHRLEIVFAR